MRPVWDYGPPKSGSESDKTELCGGVVVNQDLALTPEPTRFKCRSGAERLVFVGQARSWCVQGGVCVPV